MISLKNVSASYEDGVEVLHDISLVMPDSRNVCILGNNGSGKTTLLKAISGLLPHKGEIFIDGADSSRMSRHEMASHISLMSQFSEVYFSYSVYDTVMLGRYVHSNSLFGRTTAGDRQRVEQCLEETGIADLKDRQIRELSGGQLQRVLLARTFVQDTNIILLDEPTNHLDMRYQEEMTEYLLEWSQRGKNMLVGVFHDISIAEGLADDVILMKDGCIFSQGNKDSVLDAAKLEAAFGIDVAALMKKRYGIWGDLQEDT